MTTSKHIILYAEDDMDDVLIVKQAFEKNDHITVVHSFNGKEAYQLWKLCGNKIAFPALLF